MAIEADAVLKAILGLREPSVVESCALAAERRIRSSSVTSLAQSPNGPVLAGFAPMPDTSGG